MVRNAAPMPGRGAETLMEALFKKYFWTVNVLVLTVAAYLSASTVNEYVSDTLFGGEEPSEARLTKRTESADPVLSGVERGRAYASVLDDRHVFDSDPKDEAPEEIEDTEETEEKPEEVSTEGELEDAEIAADLIGVLVASEPGLSIATLTLAGETLLVRVGTKIKQDPEAEEALAEVKEIRRYEIVVLETGKTKLTRIRLWAEKKAAAAPPRGRGRPEPRPNTRPTPTPPGGDRGDDFSRGVRKVSMYSYEVDRAMLDEQLADLTQLGRDARIVPNWRNGQYQGFKLIGVKPGSLYRALGIRSGDIIQRVNGEEMSSPNKAIGFLEQLRTKKEITIDIERRGQKRSLTYQIK